jgi:Xaa-Pro aminopeptidase
MPVDVTDVQRFLRAEGLDGWLLYDFHGSNPIAARIAGLMGAPVMTTRRWYYLIPAEGDPRGLVHAIERHNLDALPGAKTLYSSKRQLDCGLTTLLSGMRRVAMEYSPDCSIPYVSRVDGGTIEAVRRRGAEVVSSADLVQRYEASWDAKGLQSHRHASERLYRIKDRTFDTIFQRVRDRIETTEYDVQQWMWRQFQEESLVSDAMPVVAAEAHAGNPHYIPPTQGSHPIREHELVLLDLWGKLGSSGSIYADITWVGFTGATVPDAITRAFLAARDARDTAIALVQHAASERRELRGWEVDTAARQVLEDRGYGGQILHRTGHSLGESVHGNGVNLDDFETHDTRRVSPGTGFTIEPGVYFDTFGVRTEINMFVGDGEATVTGPAQDAIVQP